MRLFVAVDPPPTALAALRAGLAQARTATEATPAQRTDDPIAGPSLRWVDPALWHLTLAFFAEVGDSRLTELSARLARAAGRHRPVSLRLAGAGCFPSRRSRATVLWSGVAGDREPLTRLAASLTAAGRRVGAKVDARTYRPHLTLARSRTPVDLGPVVSALAGHHGPSWTATQVHLVRSWLGPRPRHERLAAFPLGPAGRPGQRLHQV